VAGFGGHDAAMTNDITDISSATTAAQDDPRPKFLLAVRTATPVIAGVRADQLDLSTPCVELDVKGLLDHLVFVVRRVAKLCRGHEAFAPGSLGELPGNAGGDWSAAWIEGVAAVENAVSDAAVLEARMVLPWATLTGAEMLGMYTGEITTHTWDLATATGQSVEWDDAVVALALSSMHRDLPMADRGPMWEAFRSTMPADVRFDPPFANAVAVASDAPLIDQLVSWLGRKP
jgi:uncharacterized protein (TIGR03086 family)